MCKPPNRGCTLLDTSGVAHYVISYDLVNLTILHICFIRDFARYMQVYEDVATIIGTRVNASYTEHGAPEQGHNSVLTPRESATRYSATLHCIQNMVHQSRDSTTF